MFSEEQIAALIIFPLALTGVVANWTVAFLIRKLPSLKNSFGRLTASQSIGDAIHCSIFAFAFSPMCFFGIDFLKTHSNFIGQSLLVAYDISTYSHFCISMNRFCSIVAPLKYDVIFSARNTRVFIFLSWAAAIIPSFYLYTYNDCKLVYYEDFWVFLFLTTPVCNNIVMYADFLKYNSIVIAIVVIDVITVSRVRSFKAGLSNTSTNSQVNRKAAEINFLKQACLQAFVFTCELTTYFIITPRVDPSFRWLRFSFTTVAWVLVHMLDGIITISFNQEFAQIICRRIKIKDAVSRHSQTKDLSAVASATTQP